MKRTQLNFLIDAAAFVEFAFLLTTGVLVRYLLPPGSGHSATMLGMDRHEWGGLHFWIAMAFLATLSVHLVLHWKWIVCVLKGQRGKASGRRLALGALALTLVVALAAAPLAAPVQTTPAASGDKPAREEVRDVEEEDHQIRGSMTLAEVEQVTGVSITEIKLALHLPDSVRADDRLGPLRRQFGFEMQDVRDAVARHGVH